MTDGPPNTGAPPSPTAEGSTVLSSEAVEPAFLFPRPFPRYPWAHIVIHHSLTPDGNAAEWDAIRHYHVDVKGWDDIGYHFGVEKVNGSYQIRHGRPLDCVGAHCKENGMNHFGIGICLVGNFDLEPPPEIGLYHLAYLIRCLRAVYQIPVANVVGHREVGFRAGYDWTKGQYKSCPGAKFNLERLRSALLYG